MQVVYNQHRYAQRRPSLQRPSLIEAPRCETFGATHAAVFSQVLYRRNVLVALVACFACPFPSLSHPILSVTYRRNAVYPAGSASGVPSTLPLPRKTAGSFPGADGAGHEAFSAGVRALRESARQDGGVPARARS